MENNIVIGGPQIDVNQVFGFFGNITFDLILKVFILAALVLYAIFAFIVTRQVHLMTESVETEINGLLKTLAFLHAVVAVGVVVLGFVML